MIASFTAISLSSNERVTNIIANQPHYSGNVEFVPGSQVGVGNAPANVRLLEI